MNNNELERQVKDLELDLHKRARWAEARVREAVSRIQECERRLNHIEKFGDELVERVEKVELEVECCRDLTKRLERLERKS